MTWFIGTENCFHIVLGKLCGVEGDALYDPVPADDLQWVWDTLLNYFGSTIVITLGPARLPVTTRLLKDLEFLYKHDTPTWLDLRDSIVSIKTCYEAELKSMAFFGLSEEENLYDEPTEGWGDVIDRFGCGDDIEEASKCIALERYTASVFHLMKVVERAVIELQVFLKNTADPKAHFGGVLSKLEDMVQKTRFEHIPSDLQPHIPFMRDLLPQLHAIKDAWRDKVAHVDNKIIPIESFQPDKAKEIYRTTLALMQKLASGLPR